MVFYTEEGLRINLTTPIKNDNGVMGEGGEGIVYQLSPSSQLPNCKQYVAKIYKNPDNLPDWHENKLKRLIQISRNPNMELKGICFPLHLLYTNKKKSICVGFIMDCHKGDVLGQSVLVPSYIKNNIEWTRIELATLASIILKRFICLHDAGILMADINPGNIIIDNFSSPFFIDVDSYQVESYPCQVCRIEFISQRLVNKMGESNVLRNKEDEYYAIAVLLFMIFLVGKHPYTRRGKGSMEKNLRERNFIYPIGYDDSTNIPRGPYQRIWYNLPFKMRQAFFMVFHEGKRVSPSEWLEIINDYQSELRLNSLPREIFPDYEKIREPECCMELTPKEFDIAIHRGLREFENILLDNKAKKRFAFLEFGSNSFIGFDPRGRKKTGKLILPTHHFDYIDKYGKMNCELLINALRDSKCLPKWEKYIKGILPAYNRIYAFGGSLLRNIANREEVVKTLKEEIGYSFGILSLEEETSALIEACDKQIGNSQKRDILLVDVGGVSTTLSLRGKGSYINVNEYFKLGRNILHNRFFNTAFSDRRLLTMFEEHDKIVSEEFHNYKIPLEKSVKLLGTGIIRILNSIMGYSSSKEKYNLKELKVAKNELTEELTLNRNLAHFLYDDIASANNDNLTNKTDLRLCIPVYLNIMEHLNIDTITVMPFDLGEAFININIKKIEDHDNNF